MAKGLTAKEIAEVISNRAAMVYRDYYLSDNDTESAILIRIHTALELLARDFREHGIISD